MSGTDLGHVPSLCLLCGVRNCPRSRPDPCVRGTEKGMAQADSDLKGYFSNMVQHARSVVRPVSEHMLLVCICVLFCIWRGGREALAAYAPTMPCPVPA
eukprot:3940814-Rhodomonas_salina.3